MGQINRLLLVENESKDLRFATDTALWVGISGIEARTSVTAARDYLEKGLNGEVPLPDGIVLDLDLGYEAGMNFCGFGIAARAFQPSPSSSGPSSETTSGKSASFST